MNNCTLIGHLCADPELRYLANANNTAMARFTVAVDRNYNKGNTDHGMANDRFPIDDEIPF